MINFASFYNNSYTNSQSSTNNVNLNTTQTDFSTALNLEKASEIKEEPRSTLDSNSINIFGLSFNFDDILIICILLFLLNEGVDDDLLYIALFLLLLS